MNNLDPYITISMEIDFHTLTAHSQITAQFFIVCVCRGRKRLLNLLAVNNGAINRLELGAKFWPI